MIDGSSLLTLAHHQHPSSYDTDSLRHATLRRKSAHLWDITQGSISGYPSPPMSSPPSPTRRPSDLTLPSTRSEQFLPTSTHPPLTSSTPTQSLQQTTSSTAAFGITKPEAPTYHPPPSFATGLGNTTFGSGPGPYATSQYAPPPTAHQRTTSHDARKAKTHVASACVNCKRAHLSCDVQRPCARCTASGKQVSILRLSCSQGSQLIKYRTHAMMLLTRSVVDHDFATNLNSVVNDPCQPRMLQPPQQHR